MVAEVVDDARTDPPLSTWFQELRHIEKIVGVSDEIYERDLWRKYSKERMKTVSVALVLCLNLGVDPPDVPRPDPCARKECWIDPQGISAQKAIIRISNALQRTYERWQPRARYKIANDPTVDDVRRLCQGLRRNAKEERVLFHYNGHGVPKPTENGEIWVFNKNFTQYIPLSIFDLQSWLGHPSIYVWDCHAAGMIVKSFLRFADDHEKEWVKQLDEHMETRPHPLPVIQSGMNLEEKAKAFGFRRKPNFKECIHVAACKENEFLPLDPKLPADLFTTCLITPIQTSLLWYILKNKLEDQHPLALIDQIPGQMNDRRTILGELNWIFTAITDTIAWTSFPPETFQKLFRLDLLCSSLCRSFLLAERVMRDYRCNVVSHPKLPSVYSHPLWNAWDYTLDLCLSYLRGQRLPQDKLWLISKELYFARSSVPHEILINIQYDSTDGDECDYNHNWFFYDQLRAFGVWLKYGGQRREPPRQLPIVLQVLLSQVHRVKALKLLAKFLDLGSWAVGHALAVGIFPYVLKLLQSVQKELRPWLAFIWAKILAVEPKCQMDLIKDRERGYMYFLTILNDPNVNSRQKIVPAFVTAALIDNNYRPAQELLTENRYVSICIELLSDKALGQCRLLRLWLLIGLGRLWADYDDARWQAIRLAAYERVLEFLDDPVPEVRAAAVFAIGCLVRNRSQDDEHAAEVDHDVCDKLASNCTYDGSVLVRAELVVALQWFIIDFDDNFANLFIDLMEKIELNSSNEKRCRKFSAGEQEIVSATNEDGIVERDRDRTLPRQSSRRRGTPLELMKNEPRRSCSMNFSKAVFTDRLQTKSPFEADMVHELEVVDLYSKDLSAELNHFKHRAIKQIELLNSKTLIPHIERVWLSLLTLSLDPVKKIAEMALVLINHVERLAWSKHERKRKLSYVERPSQKKDELRETGHAVTFMVGSPSVDLAASPPPTSENASNNRFRTTSENGPSRTERRLSSRKSTEAHALPIFHQSATFTPKRSTFSPNMRSMPRINDSSIRKEPVTALVSTEFVPWCTKRFTEPILHVVQGQAGDGINDRLATLSMPSDWAYHKDEGLRQSVKLEALRLEHLGSPCCSQQYLVKGEKTVKALAWSHLRPHLYSCDGKTVAIWRSETQKAHVVRQFACNDDNELLDDNVCEMFVINEMTRELLMTASEDGLVRIWDPGYSLHSYEFDSAQRLITSAFLLKGVQWSYLPISSTYCWNQSLGRIIVSGNVKICRLWDVHSEKMLSDIKLDNRKCRVTKIASDTSSNELFALGLSNGMVSLYDPRLPSRSHRVMHTCDMDTSIVGLSLYSKHGEQLDSSLRLIAGASNGDVRVWEPRMYQEAVTSFNVGNPDRSDTAFMPCMDVHNFVPLIACATRTPILRFYNFEGKEIQEIRADEIAANPRISAPTVMSFHQLMITVAVAIQDRSIACYGMSAL